MAKNKMFYAIKLGRGVKDIILNTWEECLEYTERYPAIFKSCKTEKEAKKYLKNVSARHIKYALQLEKIYKEREIMNEIQSNFNFKIPTYILEEIANLNQKNSYKDLYLYIRLAAKNSSISNIEANILIDLFCTQGKPQFNNSIL